MPVKKLKTPRQAVRIIGWILDAKTQKYLKRDYADINKVWYPISKDRLLFEADYHGGFYVELKVDSFLGKAGEIVFIDFGEY